MAETTWPDPSTTPPRQVTDIQYEKLLQFLGDGLWGSPLTPAVVGDSSGRQVKIKANTRALIKGHIYDSGTTDVVKSIAANTSGQTRLDLIVLQLDRATWRVTSQIKQGTPGATTPPSLQRDADDAGAGTGKFEVPVALVTVLNNAGTIAAGDVRPVAYYIGLPELWTTADAHSYITAATGQVINKLDVGERAVYSNGYKEIPTTDAVARLVASKAVINGSAPYSNKNAWNTIANLSVPMVAGRGYEIALDATAVTGDGRLPIGYSFRLYEGSSIIGDSGALSLGYVGIGNVTSLSVPYVASSTATKTISVQVGRLSGTGNFDVLGGRQNPFWLRVLDHGTLPL